MAAFQPNNQPQDDANLENHSLPSGGPGRNCWTNPLKGMHSFEGVVAEKIVNAGTKSEHTAVVLVTDSGEYKLRQQGGNPFVDPELQKLVGKRLSLEGTLLNSGTILIKPGTIVELP